ncbi:MAG: ATP-binding protein [Longimicrobiales bacterium]
MPMPQPDDSRHELTFDVPNDLRAIENFVQFVVDHGRRIGFDPDRLRLNLRVGLTEALANAMLYGNRQDPRKRVRVEALLTSEEISIRVTDEGLGFDPGDLPDPTLPANIMRTRGRGIFLIRRLMDRVEFNEQGNSIWMVLFNRPRGNVAEAS